MLWRNRNAQEIQDVSCLVGYTVYRMIGALTVTFNAMALNSLKFAGWGRATDTSVVSPTGSE